jgi:biopolymer transport protein ExbD/biopolymer transport protein TolR
MAFTNAKGRTQTSLSDINITPFVDVVLVLLIIFMLTAPVLQSGLVMESHKTKTVRKISQEKIVITIDRQRNYYVGDDIVNIHLLGKTVQNRLKGSATEPVYIRCEENVKFGDFVQVIDALKQANINNLNIVTDPLETSNSSS